MTLSVPNKQTFHGTPILTEVDALWEEVRIQFREAYRLEEMGDSGIIHHLGLQNVTPAVQAWSKRVHQSSDKKKQMLRLLFDQERSDLRAEPLRSTSKHGGIAPVAELPAQRSPLTSDITRPQIGRRSVNNPYTSHYQRIHQLRAEAKRVPLGDISEMIDELKENEYGAATAYLR